MASFPYTDVPKHLQQEALNRPVYVRGTILKRFLNKVVKTDSCWIWIGGRDRDGYGLTGFGCVAHRMAWKLFLGEIPSGMKVCHSCDNPPCVNPEHLFLGTHSDNMIDSVQKGRKSKLTPEQVREIRILLKTMNRQSIANIYGMQYQAIYDIDRKKTWAHLP